MSSLSVLDSISKDGKVVNINHTNENDEAEIFEIPDNAEKYYNSIVEFEQRLGAGQIVKSVDDAYLLYCEYAHTKCFSARREK